MEERLRQLLAMHTTDREAYLARLPPDITKQLRIELAKATAQTAEAPTLNMQVGSIIGDYELTGILGQGATSTVWRAQHRSLNRTVALKIIKTTIQSQWDAVITEARLVSRIQSDHIVRINSVSPKESETLYLEQELLPGAKSLSGEAHPEKRTPRSIEEALEWVRQAALGIAAAHREGVFHRDIKPANLLWTSTRGIVVTDFGGSVAAGAGPVHFIGTPEFMAPEIAERALTDSRLTPEAEALISADVYGLGATLFELIAGKPPLTQISGTQEELLRLVAKGTRNALPGHIPPRVRSLVERAMATDPKDRIASAEKLADDLRRLQTNKLMSFEEEQDKLAVSLWLRRNRSKVVLIGIGASVALIFAAGLLSGWLMLGLLRDAQAQLAAREIELAKAEENNKSLANEAATAQAQAIAATKDADEARDKAAKAQADAAEQQKRTADALSEYQKVEKDIDKLQEELNNKENDKRRLQNQLLLTKRSLNEARERANTKRVDPLVPKSGEPKQTEPEPEVSKAGEPKPEEQKAIEPKPENPKPVELKPETPKPIEAKPEVARTAENTSDESMPGETTSDAGKK